MTRTFRAAAIVAGTLGLAAALLAAPVNAQPAPENESVSDSARPKAKRCHGKKATIVAASGATSIVGTPRRDIIWAGGGPDTVLARGGNDGHPRRTRGRRSGRCDRAGAVSTGWAP